MSEDGGVGGVPEVPEDGGVGGVPEVPEDGGGGAPEDGGGVVLEDGGRGGKGGGSLLDQDDNGIGLFEDGGGGAPEDGGGGSSISNSGFGIIK